MTEQQLRFLYRFHIEHEDTGAVLIVVLVVQLYQVLHTQLGRVTEIDHCTEG